MKIRFVAAFLPLLAVSLCAGEAAAQPCDAKPCKDHGFCTRNKDGECGAASDSDCSSSKACKSKGFCKHHGGACIQGSDKDCKKSAYCKPYGLCSFSNNKCVATDKACQASDGCKTLGMCTAENGTCAVSKASDCKALDGCKKFGKCTSKGNGCIVGSDKDCASSEVCTKAKACKKGNRFWGRFTVNDISKMTLADGVKFTSIGGNIPQDAPSLVAGEDVECLKVFKTVDFESPSDRAAGKEKAEKCCKAAAKGKKGITCTDFPNGGKHTSVGIKVKKKCMVEAGFTKGKVEAFALCRIKTPRCTIPPEVLKKMIEEAKAKAAKGAPKGK